MMQEDNNPSAVLSRDPNFLNELRRMVNGTQKLVKQMHNVDFSAPEAVAILRIAFDKAVESGGIYGDFKDVRQTILEELDGFEPMTDYAPNMLKTLSWDKMMETQELLITIRNLCI